MWAVSVTPSTPHLTSHFTQGRCPRGPDSWPGSKPLPGGSGGGPDPCPLILFEPALLTSEPSLTPSADPWHFALVSTPTGDL